MSYLGNDLVRGGPWRADYTRFKYPVHCTNPIQYPPPCLPARYGVSRFIKSLPCRNSLNFLTLSDTLTESRERWNISLQGVPARWSWNPTILVWNWHYWYGVHTFGLIKNEVSCMNPIPKTAKCWKTHTRACKPVMAPRKTLWYGIGITGMGFTQLDPLFTTLCVPTPYQNSSFWSRTLGLTPSRHDLVWNWHTKYSKQ